MYRTCSLPRKAWFGRVGSYHRTVCKMIGFQGFWRFKAIYFSIGAFFVNIPWGNLAPLNSKEIWRFTFGRFSLVRSQTHVRNCHFLQNYQVVKSDTRYRRNLNLVSGTWIRYSKPVLSGTKFKYCLLYTRCAVLCLWSVVHGSESELTIDAGGN